MNCIIECVFFYYYTTYDHNKSTEKSICPYDYSLLIKNKKKCFDICKKDNESKYNIMLNVYQNAKIKNNNFNKYLYIDKDLNKCALSDNEFYSLNEKIRESELEIKAKYYVNTMLKSFIIIVIMLLYLKMIFTLYLL